MYWGNKKLLKHCKDLTCQKTAREANVSGLVRPPVLYATRCTKTSTVSDEVESYTQTDPLITGMTQIIDCPDTKNQQTNHNTRYASINHNMMVTVEGEKCALLHAQQVDHLGALHESS